MDSTKQKAWIINKSNISEPWFVTDNPFYGNKRSEARKEALEEIGDQFVDKSDRPIDLLSIRLKRAKHLDKLLVDGVYKTIEQIEKDAKEKAFKENLDKILAENADGYAYVYKKGNYYRPRSAGYTEHRSKAGVYSVKDAVAEVRGCSIDDLMSVELINIEEHNARINKEIEDLQSRLIIIKKNTINHFDSY